MIIKRITIDFETEEEYKDFKAKIKYFKKKTYITNNGNVIRYCVDAKFDMETDQEEEHTIKTI
ncbi:hypothetical protein ELUMI_v1c02700 [Williamsoniiplasma luminosum]|uniref:Uncharacterized protein n=1 Tax=Williamsoniiplasma luminosum TaxID=214888 RepID=A0A2K8NT24_9MOLU|nr:hypothetical protein [Williamsoniiplasma luminosum]ATZ16993.1 hypothetical protein ELUMI_v1c02680 [Williamsoniiplasma luminosum]ATZ16995.1 hypothetical protein ELUMI_v1c02700 [Williamsoniiplasma luminosum]